MICDFRNRGPYGTRVVKLAFSFFRLVEDSLGSDMPASGVGAERRGGLRGGFLFLAGFGEVAGDFDRAGDFEQLREPSFVVESGRRAPVLRLDRDQHAARDFRDLFGEIVQGEESLGGSAFQVSNPQAASGCGCGSSFSV